MRPRTTPRPRSRAPWLLSAVAVLLVGGCSVTPDSGLSVVGSTAECDPLGISIDSPVEGAALRPGRVLALVHTTEPGAVVTWRLRAADGAVRGSGAVMSDVVDPTSFTLPLELSDGEYELSVRGVVSGRDPGGAARCAEAARTIRVSSAVTGVTWGSGASGDGVATGGFAAWRETPLTVAGTWVDDNSAQLALWSLQPGGEYDGWTGDLDVAVGAIGPGESWAAAARGAYDGRWALSLQRMARLSAGGAGTVYVRFAHEMNGTWYPWSVTTASARDFVSAWHRYRALQLEYFPAARLVFSINSETPAELGLDWRTLFPGPEVVDVVSMSYFNSFPGTVGVTDFWVRALARDPQGAPRGIVRVMEFARSVGLPFAVSEWGPHAQFGDAPVYMEQMYQLFRANAGSGPGQVLYEVLYNVSADGDTFGVWPGDNAPGATEAYRRLW